MCRRLVRAKLSRELFSTFAKRAVSMPILPSKMKEREMTNKTTTVRPGHKVPDSGIYKESNSGRRATLVLGEPAPPTPNKGGIWKQVVATNTNKKS